MADAKLAYRWIEGQGEAFGAPGAEPRWTSSEKDVASTAYATSSKLWWTSRTAPSMNCTTPPSTGRRCATWS
jgi:hypothetical protein